MFPFNLEGDTSSAHDLSHLYVLRLLIISVSPCNSNTVVVIVDSMDKFFNMKV